MKISSILKLIKLLFSDTFFILEKRFKISINELVSEISNTLWLIFSQHSVIKIMIVSIPIS